MNNCILSGNHINERKCFIMSHATGKKETRKQAMKSSKPEVIHNDEMKKHKTEKLTRGDR